MGLVSTFVVLALLALVGLWIYDKVRGRMDQNRWERERERQRREEELAEAKRKASVNTMYRYLSCPTVPSQGGLKRIPLARRTVRLVFLGAKRRVCLPFAG